MIYLAPLQGYTEYIFRNVYSRHYTGIDIAVSPFISLVHGVKINPRIAKDVLPSNNHLMPVIPQILGNNPEHFIRMCEFLYKLGYNQINWNMGCPVKNITRKKRGSGILPYPELVREILDKVIPNIPQSLSVKIRLGLNNENEIAQLIPVLNDFPLENIIIHPRIAKQMYEGNINHEIFQKNIPLIKHEIIYNGDIFTFKDFVTIKNKYPTIKKWMIGRGVFYNPLLPSLIKGEKMPDIESFNKQFLNFTSDLYNELKIYRKVHTMVSIAKNYWKLFSKGFANSEEIFKHISHANSMEEITNLSPTLLSNRQLQDY